MIAPLTISDLRDLYALSSGGYWTGTRFPALESRGYLRAVNIAGRGSTWQVTPAGLATLDRWDAKVVQVGAMLTAAIARGPVSVAVFTKTEAA